MHASKSQRASRPSKTSLEILRERDALRTRVHIVEAALGAIQRETQHAVRHPEMSVLALCRIATLAEQALDDRG